MPEQDAEYNEDQHWLQLIRQYLDTSSGSNMDLIKFQDKYIKEFRCLIVLSK